MGQAASLSGYISIVVAEGFGRKNGVQVLVAFDFSELNVPISSLVLCHVVVEVLVIRPTVLLVAGTETFRNGYLAGGRIGKPCVISIIVVSANSNRLPVYWCLLTWRSNKNGLPSVVIHRVALKIVVISMPVVPLYILHRFAVLAQGLVPLVSLRYS